MLSRKTDTPLKSFRALPQSGTSSVPEIAVLARSDFEALTQAQQLIGSVQPFALYEGQRLVANYKPVPGLAALLGIGL